MPLKVSSYSALFAVRCGALTYVPLKFEFEYDIAPHRTANNAEFELANKGDHLYVDFEIGQVLTCPRNTRLYTLKLGSKKVHGKSFGVKS